jgi:hypothetical protein
MEARMIGKRALGAALVLLAAGCATPPASVSPAEQARLAALRDKLQNSPTLRLQLIHDCAQSAMDVDPVELQAMARLMQVPEQDVVRVYCRRLLAGVADGRVTVEDLKALAEQRNDATTWRRLLPVILDEGATP